MSERRAREAGADRTGGEGRSAQKGRVASSGAAVEGVASSYRIVAVPAAVALGAVGAIAAEHANVPWILGALAGTVAAVLGVLALPSIPTRRATVVLLGLGGLAALRHASFAGDDRSWLLVIWAAATMFTLVLVDRADAEMVPALDGGTPLPSRLGETARVGALVSLIVIVASVAFVPTVTSRLGRKVWPGLSPTDSDLFSSPSSLHATAALDLTSRPRLSDAVVFTVDASHPDFWRGETFDLYEGSSWKSSFDHAADQQLMSDGSQVQVAAPLYDNGARNGRDFRQTFHIEAGYTDVVFAAPSPRIVETDKTLLRAPDGSLRVEGAGSEPFPNSAAGFGKGAVYTVTSRSLPVTADALRQATGDVPVPIAEQYALMPGTTPRVAALARTITRDQTNTYDRVKALENWLGDNTRYSLNAPLSPRNVDVVDDFLFRSRVGWCEQIASSLVVMARSVGIPARLVTGFVPGSRDALTGRFVVRERDAHAWAEIYFAGIGWQGFDPTQKVPLAGDVKSSGSWLASARHNAVPLAIFAVLIAIIVASLPELIAASRRRRARQASWSAQALHRLERAGRKAGRARAPSETPREYAEVLAERLGDDRLAEVGATLDTALYSAHGAPDEARDRAEAVLTSL
jgi:protein-glutamine gamma-glutamyltransferase